MKKIGLTIFSSTKPEEEQRKLIKHLVNLLDMDGSYAGWRAMHNIPPHLSLGHEGGDGPLLHLSNGEAFPVRKYFKQQPERTEWLAQRLPDLLELEKHWKASMGGNSEPERTLKSDILAEWEAISRTEKVRWAEENGHDWLSLQHDGVIIALHTGLTKDQAILELQVLCSRALGYQQPIEAKPMSAGDLAALPACDRRPAPARESGGGAGGV